MGRFGEVQRKKILRDSRIGMWRIEMEEGKPPRFYADEVMDELLGASETMTAEERFLFHRKKIHPEDQKLFEEYANRLMTERTEIVYRYIHPISGEMFVRCAGARDESIQAYVSIEGTHQDISDTVRLEKNNMAEQRLAKINNSLRRRQELQDDYYRKLLDIQNCGVMAYTLPGHRMIHMNAEALRMYDLKSIDEAQKNLGFVLKDVYYPDPGTIDQLKQLRTRNGSVDYECVLRKGKENECHILAKTKVVQLPNGETAVVTAFLDISDMITLKNALKKAEAGSRAKSAFLFAMSHDLRTPMNAIIGYAELIETHWGEQECTKKYLHKLREASQFLLSLIGNILELSRIESGKESLHEEPWNLLNINETLDVVMDGDISPKQLTMNRSIQVRHTDIICDAMKMREIIMNLLSNAIKYTPTGGTVGITIEELPSEQEGYALYRTTVSDTGIGIGKEYIPHLFEAFSRERSSSESGIKGTGLGLSIVKSFTELMHGTIEVESKLGKGTKFILTIPHRIASPEEIAFREKADDTEQVKASLAGKRVLLAEDNELNAEITMTILEDAHLQAELAKNGEQAIEMLKKAPVGYYDLILMDIQMPVLNGYEASAKIRRLPDEQAKIPIIAMTANAFEEDRQAAFKAGMDDYVVKPVEIGTLLSTMAKTLKKQRIVNIP